MIPAEFRLSGRVRLLLQHRHRSGHMTTRFLTISMMVLSLAAPVAAASRVDDYRVSYADAQRDAYENGYYDSRYGSKETYRVEYRRGFEEGYNRAYREGRR